MGMKAFGQKGRLSRGLSLMEVGLSLGLVALMGGYIANTISDQTQAQRAASSADMMSTVHDASTAYLRTYYQQLTALIPADGASSAMVFVGRPSAGAAVPGSTIVGLPSLQGGGFLPPSFIDKDAFRMHHQLLIRQSAPGILEGLIIQADDSILPGNGAAPAGTVLKDVDIGRMVARMGSFGGAEFTNNVNAANAGVVLGNSGSWATNAADWNSSLYPPVAGRAAATVSFGTAGLSSDYLDRYNIGVPEANTMRTGLNMGNNDINAARNYNATGNMINQGQIVAGMPSNLGHQGSVVMANGGFACAYNISGCTFWISDDGGFQDNNDGFITFQGNYATGGLRLSGAGNNLVVDGNSTVSGDSTVVGNANVDNSLSVNIDSFIGRDMHIGRNMNLTGDADIGGVLYANGNISTGQDLSAGRNLYVNNTATVGQDMNVGGNMYTTGFTSTNGDSYVGGNISSIGTIYSQAAISTAGNINAGGDIGASGSVYGQTGLSTGGDVNATYGSVNAGQNMSAGNQIYAGGNILSNASIGATQNLTAGGQIHANLAIGSNAQVIAGDYIETLNSGFYAPNGGVSVSGNLYSYNGGLVTSGDLNSINGGVFANQSIYSINGDLNGQNVNAQGTVNAAQVLRNGQSIDDIAKYWAQYCYATGGAC